MKRILLLLVLASFTGLWAMAADITPEQALQQARLFMQKKMQREGKGLQAPAVAPQMELAGRVNDLYVFNVMKSDGGYVIVSNDDCAVPVLGYSERGSLDIEHMPENMRAWLQGYADEIAWAKAHPSQMAPAMHRAKSNVKTPIAPLMQTLWNQGSPYNDLCPEYAPGKKCATGCVATAMAQCMYYTEMRAGSTTTYTTADIPGYVGVTYGIAVEGITAGTPIDWYKMSPVYNNGDTDEAAVAVAQLMKYCGASVEMDYGPESGACTQTIADALKAFFGYDETVTCKARCDYSYADWIDMMYHELSLGRVICYGGVKWSTEGHLFVCDGYQGEDFFHINWGWGGLSDDYFKLSALDPDAEGIGGATSEGGYCLGQDAVVGIQKVGEDLGEVLQVEPYNYDDLNIGTVTIDKNEITGGESVEVTMPFFNSSSQLFDGQVALLSASEDSYEYEVVASTMVLIPAGQHKDCVIKFTPKDETHNYQLRVAVAMDDMFYFWGQQVLELSVTESGAITTDNMDLALSNAVVTNYENVDGKEVFYSNKLEGVMTFTNETEANYSGTIQVDVYDLSFNLMGSTYKPCNIPAKGSVSIPFVATGLTYGEKYVISHIYNQNGGWSKWHNSNPIECRPAIIVADGEGKTTASKPTATFHVPDNATSVILTACHVETVEKNSNPNTLYILGTGEDVPAGLTNVVKADAEGNYTAETITLTDGHNFLSPVNFTAQKVEFTYGNVTQCDEHIRWNTLMLPFEATTVTADGETIDWRHSSTDDNGRFWLKRFVGDDVDRLYFESEAGNSLEANVPYLFAMPVDLSDKTIKFVGENTTVKKADAISPFTAQTYSFVGSTCAVSTENIYMLNEGGSAFVLGQGSDAFRAYFKPVTFNPAVVRLRINTGETSGMHSMLNSQCLMLNEMYDLQGRRVSPQKKGIYITNGKKVVYTNN